MNVNTVIKTLDALPTSRCCLEKKKKKKKKPGVTLDKSLWDFQVRINETNLV